MLTAYYRALALRHIGKELHPRKKKIIYTIDLEKIELKEIESVNYYTLIDESQHLHVKYKAERQNENESIKCDQLIVISTVYDGWWLISDTCHDGYFEPVKVYLNNKLKQHLSSVLVNERIQIDASLEKYLNFDFEPNNLIPRHPRTSQPRKPAMQTLQPRKPAMQDRISL
jgi:hypothetical protein